MMKDTELGEDSPSITLPTQRPAVAASMLVAVKVALVGSVVPLRACFGQIESW
jgi:hypothetical protein